MCISYMLLSMNQLSSVFKIFFFLMIRRPPRSTQGVSSAASDVYKRQHLDREKALNKWMIIAKTITEEKYKMVNNKIESMLESKRWEDRYGGLMALSEWFISLDLEKYKDLSLIHISEPTRPLYISYAVFCLKKKKKETNFIKYTQNNKNKNQTT
eukprot:TRINITY_DN40124_c0_g1_i2.p2 TRINITY_DN40124_c0_g1~~TRINITY_DN40124_c0_g1_i2.p2  ORF type:complete len:155 (+),score=47.62 TRINITY_DN40124_c0_g1_i2:58-522(+)